MPTPERTGRLGQVAVVQLASLADERGVAGLGERGLQRDGAELTARVVAVVLEPRPSTVIVSGALHLRGGFRPARSRARAETTLKVDPGAA